MTFGWPCRLLTEQRDVVRCPWDVVGDIEKEEAEGEKHSDSDMHLLRWNTEEDRQKKRWRHNAREDDVDQVEGTPAPQVKSEDDVREALVSAAFEEELASVDDRPFQRPLSVAFVGVENDRWPWGRQVHLRRIVRPSAEDQFTRLSVEWIVGDIYGADGLEDPGWFPSDGPSLTKHSGKLLEVTIYGISP